MKVWYFDWSQLDVTHSTDSSSKCQSDDPFKI